jgi:LL-diaminopimelate aminotransferase
VVDTNLSINYSLKVVMEKAKRISHLRPYFFSDLGKRLVTLKNNGMDVIRLDMGSPDLPPPGRVIDTLKLAAENPHKHGYTLGSGTQEFRNAVSQYYSKRFGVELDQESEVIDLIGSKEGLFILSQVLLNQGDLALVPDPSYSVYAQGAKIAGADVYWMPLVAENAFLPDLAAIPENVAQRAKILWMNYPNNPTGAIASKEFFQEAISFAKKYDVLLAHDAPYMEVGFDGYRAPSLLSEEGAKDVALEFNSLSKSYNMAGWRIAMVAGNPDVIAFIETYKSQQDSAIFAPILAAAEIALQTDQKWITNRNQVYQTRRDMVLDGLHSADVRVESPQAALYVWVPLPALEMTSMEFCKRLLEDTGVSTTPGSVFGNHGEGYLRISLVNDKERIKEGISRMSDWIQKQA